MDDKYLDNVNNARVQNTKLRVAHAIKLLNNPIGCLCEERKLDDAETNIAHAINLLEAANQEMTWACEHFEWNDEVCIQINDACGKLGNCLAILVAKNDADYDIGIAGYEGKDAMNILGKALATLVRWFSDDVDVSEI